ASWNDASTCTISGYTTNATAPTNLNQAFGNFIWDTPNQDFLSFIDLGGLLTQVDGNLSILNSPGYIGFTQGIPLTLNVGGNLFLGSEFVFSDAADVTINVAGNTEFAGGFNFLT